MDVNLIPMGIMDVLRILHRGDGAIVSAFHKTTEDGKEKFPCLGSFTVDEWPEHLHQLKPYQHNLYITINSTARKAQRFHNTSEKTGLPIYSRKARFLAWINAVVIDIDLAHAGQAFSFDASLSSFLSDAERRGVPHPSMVCNSGRGLWAIWRLRDRRDDTPISAWENLQRYAEKINHLAAKMFHADTHCVDVARVMRWPGSINPKATPDNQTVTFYCLSHKTFTLHELGATFGLAPSKTSFEREYKRDSQEKSERHVKAGYARWAVPLEGFLALRKMRSGFSSGTRTMAVFYYAFLLRKARRDALIILSECLKLAAECSPPLDPKHAQAAVSSSRDVRWHVRHDTLARDLRITAEEMGSLPGWFKPVRQSKSMQVAQRRAAVASVLKDEGQEVSLREMAQILTDRHGITVTHVTIRSDLMAIKKAGNPTFLTSTKNLTGEARDRRTARACL